MQGWGEILTGILSDQRGDTGLNIGKLPKTSRWGGARFEHSENIENKYIFKALMGIVVSVIYPQPLPWNGLLLLWDFYGLDHQPWSSYFYKLIILYPVLLNDC